MQRTSKHGFYLSPSVPVQPLSPSQVAAKQAIDREFDPMQRLQATNLLGLPGAWAANELLLHFGVALRYRIVVGLAVWVGTGIALRRGLGALYRRLRNRAAWRR